MSSLIFHNCYFENNAADQLGCWDDGSLYTLGMDVLDGGVLLCTIGYVPNNPVHNAEDISIANKALYSYGLIGLPVVTNEFVDFEETKTYLEDWTILDCLEDLFGDERKTIGAFSREEAVPESTFSTLNRFESAGIGMVSLAARPTPACFIKISQDDMRVISKYQSSSMAQTSLLVTDFQGYKANNGDIHEDIIFK